MTSEMPRKAMLPKCLFVALLALVVAGCGSLQQSVSSSGLTKENMKFINAQPPVHNMGVIEFMDGQRRFPIGRRAVYIVPLVPLFYVEALGKVKSAEQYCFLSGGSILLLFGYNRVTLFGKDGQPVHTETRTGFLLDLLNYRSTTLDMNGDKPTSRWRLKFLDLPLLGPLFGIGDNYTRVLFIPVK